MTTSTDQTEWGGAERRAQIVDRLIAVVDLGESVHLIHNDPKYGEMHTYLCHPHGGYWMICGADHRTSRVGPTGLRGFLSADVHQGWHEPDTE